MLFYLAIPYDMRNAALKSCLPLRRRLKLIHLSIAFPIQFKHLTESTLGVSLKSFRAFAFVRFGVWSFFELENFCGFMLVIVQLFNLVEIKVDVGLTNTKPFKRRMQHEASPVQVTGFIRSLFCSHLLSEFLFLRLSLHGIQIIHFLLSELVCKVSMRNRFIYVQKKN